MIELPYGVEKIFRDTENLNMDGTLEADIENMTKIACRILFPCTTQSRLTAYML